MNRHAIVSYIILILACALLCWLTGCSPTQIAGGTETQNPEIVAMAKAAFGAADADGKWRPTFYLRDSSQKASLGKTARRATGSSLVFSTSVIASRSDTLFTGANVSVIRDTAYISANEITIDTVIVDKTLFKSDTVVDTLRSSAAYNRMSITHRIAIDSIFIKDTVILVDTIVKQYKRVIVTVNQSSDAARAAVVSADTQYADAGLSGGHKSNDSGEIPDFKIQSITPSWQLDNINYSSAQSPISYRFVSPPTKDTAMVASGVNALHIHGNDLFLSQSTFDDNLLVETIKFNALDSLLSIVSFNPSPFDTAETLTTKYSVDIGANAYSGADDQLLGITRSIVYRLGKFRSLDLTLSPDQSKSAISSKKVFNGMVSMSLIRSNGTTGSFSGVVDSTQGIIGIYQTDGKKYQVSCDHSFKILVTAITPQSP